MGIFTKNYQNLNQIVCWKIQKNLRREINVAHQPDATHQPNLPTCPSTLGVATEVLVCQGSVVCFGADDYGQSKTEKMQTHLVTV